MPVATGLFKQVSIKKEATFNTAPGTTLFTPLRRVTSQVDLVKDTYQSNELATHMQVADFRHGVRRVQGNINGELAPGAYSAIFEGLLKRDWTAGVSASSVSLTIAGSGPTYTVTRGAGSYLSDGFKVGDVVRLSVGSLNANNINKNLLIVDIGSATVITVIPLNGTAMTAEGPIAGCTVAVQGKKTYVPASSQTDNSYAIEHWHPDVTLNELYLGCKFAKADLNLPATGLATASFDLMGASVTTAASRYATTFNTLNTAGLTAAVNGVLVVNGSAIATVTGLQLSIMQNLTGDPVVGSNVVPALYPGRVQVSGQFTAYFDSATLRDLFINETETSLVVSLTSDNTATSKCISICLPRIKVGGATKSDGESGIVQTLPFTALYNAAGGTGVKTEQTTITMQDTDA